MSRLIVREHPSWPRIRIPGPKESGKWSHGRIGILCFSFTDEYPSRVNNFLWKVRSWPVIGWISTLWSRGGVSPCAVCGRGIWPHHCGVEQYGGVSHQRCSRGISDYEKAKVSSLQKRATTSPQAE